MATARATSIGTLFNNSGVSVAVLFEPMASVLERSVIKVVAVTEGCGVVDDCP